MEPDEWIVGVKYDDGELDTLKNGGGIDPSLIAEIVFPVSANWEDGPALYPTPIEVVETQNRNQGPERHYSARIEDRVPNSDQLWEIELELWEYPPEAFNMSSLSHSHQIRNAVWDEDDLLNAMAQMFD